jgi:hypothetical protein
MLLASWVSRRAGTTAGFHATHPGPDRRNATTPPEAAPSTTVVREESLLVDYGHG